MISNYFEGILLNDVVLERKKIGNVELSYAGFDVAVEYNGRTFVICCETWGRVAEKVVAGYAKGSKIAIEGKLMMKNASVAFHLSHYSPRSEAKEEIL